MKLRLTAGIKKAANHQDLVKSTKVIVERMKKHFEDKNLPQEVRDTLELAISRLEGYSGMLGQYETHSREMSEELKKLSKILSGALGNKIEDGLNIEPGDEEDNTLEIILKQVAEIEKAKK